MRHLVDITEIISRRFRVRYRCLQRELCRQRSRKPCYRPSTLFVRFFVVEIRRRWPVGVMFISLIFGHFVDRITVCTSFGLFIFGYFINMHYGHIASDKGASIWERSLLPFVIRMLILHTKRTFYSAIWSVNEKLLIYFVIIIVKVCFKI